MAAQLVALCVDAHDPLKLARFWGGVLGWQQADDRDGFALIPDDDTGFRLRFLPSEAEKDRQNQMHFDLTSASPETQQRTVARALELGGRHHDVGQGPDATHVVLADPEGNEFCVIAAGNKFLAECGFVGALASDGSQQVGYFWSRALDWPLVWDQDEETAIRSPHGGPKITWGGPPFTPKTGRNRLRFDLAADGDLDTELDRLVRLGAARADSGSGPGPQGEVEMADPDGNEFTVWP
ncbi:putative enzyme related to lactoylglutathione lyase [Catenulispora sp. MAP5-51]|uniref:VOC family protein n=1 Tax=Catenulispora sp. MAP5-51 TaxID=3156298 RepID=UPI0035166F45